MLINSNPHNVMFNNVLGVFKFKPNELNVYPMCYTDGMQPTNIHNERLIACSDVFLHTTSGSDFDAAAHLAYEAGKIVVFNDVMEQATYFPRGLRITKSQRFYDGLANSVLYLPSVSQLLSIMQSSVKFCEKNRETQTKSEAVAFRAANNKFASNWNKLLKGLL